MLHALRTLGLDSHGLPTTHELERFIGPPAQEVFGDLLSTRDPVRIAEGISHYRSRYSEVGLFENEPYPGIHAALGQFRAEGFKLWVCTSKPWVFAERILEHFGLMPYFHGFYGCELDGTRSDKSELLAYLIDRESIEPSRAVMIGDRKHDARAARLNGTRSIGVLYGFGDEAELRAAGVEALCAEAMGLPDAVASLSFAPAGEA